MAQARNPLSSASKYYDTSEERLLSFHFQVTFALENNYVEEVTDGILSLDIFGLSIPTFMGLVGVGEQKWVFSSITF
jgi:hypothetical protein